MHYTTLKQLRAAYACVNGYNKLVRHLQGKPFTQADEERETHIRFAHTDPISIKTILDSNGLDDALWSLRACKQTPELTKHARLFAVWCARQVLHLMKDERSIKAIEVAERHAHGLATDEELAAAGAAVWDAAWSAAGAAARAAARDAARAAARDAARAAAGDAARAAAGDAARAAAGAAAWDAAWSAAGDAARAAAGAAVWDAAWSAAGAAQKAKFIEIFFGE